MSTQRLILDGVVIAEIHETAASLISRAVIDSGCRSEFEGVDMNPVLADKGPGTEICIRIFVPQGAR